MNKWNFILYWEIINVILENKFNNSEEIYKLNLEIT